MSPPPNQVQKLRGDGQPSRVQDNFAAVLNPLADALSKTPIMGAPPPPWIRPTLASVFADLPAPFAPTTYHRDALGYVHARVGLVSAAGTAAVDAFTFDKGYRPDSTQLFSGGDGAGNFFEFTLTAAGVFRSLTAFAAGDLAMLSFSFLAVF